MANVVKNFLDCTKSKTGYDLLLRANPELQSFQEFFVVQVNEV
jgi:hypothetical protein